MNKSPRAVHEIHYRYKKLFVINVNKPLEICSDIGFAAFGVTGRAVIDFALLTSQASKVKRTQSSILFHQSGKNSCMLSFALIFIHSDWVLLCLPHIHIRKSLDLCTSE